MVLTENNAVAHSTTGAKTIDFFTLVTRKKDPVAYFNDAFMEDPYVALQILYHLRDSRNGKGEKESTLRLLMYMKDHYPNNYTANLGKIVSEYGCYKMLCEIFARDYQTNGAATALFPLKLLADAISAGNPLAAKWAPSEHSHYNHKKQGYQLSKICKLLGLMREDGKPDFQAYRGLISPLRTKANIVEQFCCADQWKLIDFNKVAAKAMLILSKKAFPSHCPTEFIAWKDAVAEGRAQVKTAGLQPHEIIASIISDDIITGAQELQWKKMIADVGNLNKALAICDVSPSMTHGTSPRPIDVSVALSLFISELASGPFKNRVMTFSSTPQIVTIKGDTLIERVRSLTNIGWSGRTDYVKALTSLLDYGKLFSVPQEMMPECLFVMTDMEFDEADRAGRSPHEVVRSLYEASGYMMPKIIFWNLASRSDGLPVTEKDENTALVSGFSHSLLKAFLTLDPQIAFNPHHIMREILKEYKPVYMEECPL